MRVRHLWNSLVGNEASEINGVETNFQQLLNVVNFQIGRNECMYSLNRIPWTLDKFHFCCFHIPGLTILFLHSAEPSGFFNYSQTVSMDSLIPDKQLPLIRCLKSIMKSFYTVLGFLLFLFGILSIILNLVGLQFVFLTWIDSFGRLAAFILRIVMMLTGIILMYLNLVDWRQDDSTALGGK